MKNIIPIFPLNLVIFPNSKYPLHIFEERYKMMIAECQKRKEGFGIVTLLNKEISKIGCYVEIAELLREHPGGESDIIIEGKERFFVRQTRKHKYGYLTAQVDAYNDLSDDIDESLLISLKNKFEAMLQKIKFELDEAFWERYEEAECKSFKIAEKSGLSIEQQQTLLSFKDENDRMQFLIAHIEKLQRHLHESSALRSVVMCDGYLI